MAKAEDIPTIARRSWQEFHEATKENREAEEESLGFWAGGEHQWRPAEISSRKSANRPWTTINRCKPAVDQVVNEARNNPPGPQCYPIGKQSDEDTADILEGSIREYEYRSHAASIRTTALTYATAGGSGCWELATEYESDESFSQRMVLKPAPDPAAYFYDPNARLRHRQDAMWQGKISVLHRNQLEEQYPNAKMRVLDELGSPGAVNRALGWMKDVLKLKDTERDTFRTWTGKEGAGPYYVCDYWRVKIVPDELTIYSDGIARFSDKKPPKGIEPKKDPNGGKYLQRIEPRREVWKYVVTALDELTEPTKWMGSIIPIFWVMGPEIWIKGKLCRLSLITPAIGPQRSLNYTATSMNEAVGLLTKAPWRGWEGQFDITNAQGMNPWESSNSKLWAYLETKPVWTTSPDGNTSTLLPAPERNTWELSLSGLLEAMQFWGEQIKAATSVFFDPSIQTVKDVQSGEAIKELRSQTNIGTFDWQDSLRSATQLEYTEAARILPQIMDGPREITIVRPDTQHEQVKINQIFPNGIDPKTGKPGKRNVIAIGEHSVIVTAGPSFETRAKEAIGRLLDVLKIAPQILSAPGVAASIVRLMGEGNPEVEQIADFLQPPTGDVSPEQLQQQLALSNQKIQALTIILQKAQQAIASKLPEIEARKWIAAMDNATRIRVAEVNASKDANDAAADRLAALLSQGLDLAHERGLQAEEHAHAAQQQQAAAEQEQEQPEPAAQ